jgi:hypothetical protein
LRANGFYSNDAMKDPDTQEFVTKALRGTLTEAERRQWEQLLQNDAALRERFAEEAALERMLDDLPDVPISSNFTALVLQAAVRESQTEGPHSRIRLPLFRSVLARLAAGLVMFTLLAVLVGYQYRKSERADMAERVRSFTGIASAIGSEKTPPEELFQDFDAIRRLSLPAEGELDMELLFALQK